MDTPTPIDRNARCREQAHLAAQFDKLHADLLSLAARAQQPTLPVIGFLNSTSPKRYTTGLGAFHQGLGEVGYVEGRNLTIEYRRAEEQYDRLRTFAADCYGIASGA
jgi:hypothetical protein